MELELGKYRYFLFKANLTPNQSREGVKNTFLRQIIQTLIIVILTYDMGPLTLVRWPL